MARTALVPADIWHDRRSRRWIIQGAFLVALGLFAVYVWARSSNLDLGFDFLEGPAGFDLGNQWITSAAANDSRLQVYLAGVWNTVRLVLTGILFATLLGVVMGVARLSGNWLVARVAALYVEIFRNTPLLVQIVFWYTAVLLKLPDIRAQRDVGGTVFISNRGLAIPWTEPDGPVVLWLVLCAAAAAAAWYVRRARVRREESTGAPSAVNRWAAATFLSLALVAFLVTGMPLGVDTPSLVQRSGGALTYEGGIVVTPEFTAMLLALVVYTGSFITEIVRGSIQALPRGQTEASMALGMSGYQRLTLVILPQALRTMIPSVTNQYLNLSKNSSLAVAIGYSELFYVSQIYINNVGHAVPMFIVIIGTYMALSLAISAFMNWLNARVALVGRT